jgi:hypothetical protein
VRVKPSTSAAEKVHVSAGSNAYSVPETLMLKWLTLHNNCIRREATVFLRNFSADLCDSRVLAAVIISHVPSKKTALDRLDVVPEGNLHDPVLFEARVANATKLLVVLQSLQMPFLPPPEEIAGGNARIFMLLVLTIMDVCPQLIPKGAIEFNGRLNAQVVREIALNNPTGRSITYLIKLEGSDEFTCEHKYLVIPPKSSASLPVIHKAKFAQATASTLFLLPSESQDRISPLVFSLASTTVSNQPSATVIEHTGKLYEMSTIEVPVKHPFDCDMCNFVITLMERVPSGDARPSSRGKNAVQAQVKGGTTTTWKALPDKSFWIKKDKLKVGKRGHALLYVHFLPTKLVNTICSVNFKDDINGEFSIDIVARVELPAPSEIIKISSPDRRLVVKDISIAPKNGALDKSRTYMLELLGKEASTRFFKELGEAAPVMYKAQFLNPSMRGPAEVMLGPQGTSKAGKADTGDGAGKQQRDVSNRLSLQVECKGPGQYEGEIVLRSKMDVRVVTVVCSLLPREVNAELTFASPIRQSITQEIPITNLSPNDWTVQSRIRIDGQEEGSRDKVFYGPADFKVLAGKTAAYTLSFYPTKVGKVTGSLALSNITTNDTYTYTLIGEGDEPAAEDHLVLKCNARRSQLETLMVGNFAGTGGLLKDSRYSVMTDLRCITGPPIFDIPAKGTVAYPFSIMCAVGGNFYGTVTFTKMKADGSEDPDGEHFWYTVEVKADTPTPERQISVRTQVRSAVDIDIQE